MPEQFIKVSLQFTNLMFRELGFDPQEGSLCHNHVDIKYFKPKTMILYFSLIGAFESVTIKWYIIIAFGGKKIYVECIYLEEFASRGELFSMCY